MISNKILENVKHVHFIGIGGSGMYPIVQIFHSKGYYITGSDNNETETLEAVRKMGITVHLGQRAENIEGADLIIYTAAIMADNPELIASREAWVLSQAGTMTLSASAAPTERPRPPRCSHRYFSRKASTFPVSSAESCRA